MENQLEQLSTAELEKALSQRKKQEQEERALEKALYEEQRDQVIISLLKQAQALSDSVKAFKDETADMMQSQITTLEQYGAVNKKSKGGFSITHSSGNMRVTRRRDVSPQWDERGMKGIELIRSFLDDVIKKKDEDLFKILIGFLQRNKNGDLEYARVMELLKHESTYDDPRWKEGLKLIKESYSSQMRGFAYDFKLKTKDGHWDNINLNFSNL